ncbi:C2 calcium-dependent membrane targeting [Macleaya cordata]|uniref:C2 calcium-dependent membrane targeting n=1 Tax=Macleaya cordata TaxID=56857 RepID=A0A200Q042_MACCD|nr:C2 calcium-dependent membrane targeting [Macleaya cordata]
MDSHQLVVSPVKNSAVVVAEPQKLKTGYIFRNSVSLSGGIGVQREEAMVGDLEGFNGVLEVYIHQARDIHNICIYQKQDVYAKLCLTSDPETTVSTQIINGGGKNPVFNETLRLNVRNLGSSLKCEIWMLSRVKNYLEDQLLGFALVPLSDVLIGNGKLAQEFSLSSTDLFHSPAGFVELSLSYSGDSPEVLAIPTRAYLAPNKTLQDSEVTDSLPCDYDKIEFPDPNIVNENNLMVSEYCGIPCTSLDSQSSEDLCTSDSDNRINSDSGVNVVESFSKAGFKPIEFPKYETPVSSVSTNGSPSLSLPASSSSFCDTPGTSKSPNQDVVSDLKEDNEVVAKVESDSSGAVPSNTFAQSLITVNIEPQETMVQQDIVDMYMKSMQQFTESLAKMKLPMDTDNGKSENTNSSSDKKLQASKRTGSRVFYGSRAFF